MLVFLVWNLGFRVCSLGFMGVSGLEFGVFSSSEV